MNREILFKAKRKNNGEWVEGYYASWKYESVGGDHVETTVGHFIIKIDSDESDATFYEVLPETVCQYTGLTDMNGNKIFEGDKGYLRNHRENITIVYREDSFMCVNEQQDYECDIYSFTINEGLITGNIHD